MKKRDQIIQQLIANGYNDDLATQLPKLFIDDYFEEAKELLSEALDIFIDKVQSRDIIPDKDNNVFFGNFQKMNENISYLNPAIDRVFYDFRWSILIGFLTIVKRRPLINILLNGGALGYHDGELLYRKEVVGPSTEYSGLCEITPHLLESQSYSTIYIQLKDLLELLLSKGIREEDITFVYNEIGINAKGEPTLSSNINDTGIFINYDVIKKLGNCQGIQRGMK